MANKGNICILESEDFIIEKGKKTVMKGYNENEGKIL